MKILSTQRFAFWQAVVFLGLSSVVFSCKDDNLVGLEIQPEGEFDGVVAFDSFLINTTTRQADPVNSFQLQNYLGRISSAEFGETTTNIAVDFVIGTVSPLENFENYTIDSAVLHLMPTAFYGKFDEGPTVEIYRLSNPLDSSSYKSDFEPMYDMDLVGSFSLKLPTDSVATFPKIVVGDSNSLEPYQFRVPLSEDIANELREWFADSTDTKSFNGFYLKVKDEPVTNNGCLTQFSLLTAESRIRLYMTNYSDTANNNTTEDVIVTFPIGSSAHRVSTYRHNYTGSDIETALASTNISDEKVYLQGLAGSKAEIKIPALNDFTAGRNLAVSQAILTIPVDSTQTELFALYPELFLLDDDPSGESLTLDYLYSQGRHYASYDESIKSYRFDITRTVQKIFDASNNGTDVNYGFTLNAEVPTISRSGNRWYQLVLLGSENAQLKIFYTDITD